MHGRREQDERGSLELAKLIYKYVNSSHDYFIGEVERGKWCGMNSVSH